LNHPGATPKGFGIEMKEGLKVGREALKAEKGSDDHFPERRKEGGEGSKSLKKNYLI